LGLTFPVQVDRAFALIFATNKYGDIVVTEKHADDLFWRWSLATLEQ